MMSKRLLVAITRCRAMKKYIVKLTKLERDKLKQIISSGKHASRMIMHANVLLKADISKAGPGWSDGQICDVFGVSKPTVERIRKRWLKEGLDSALNPRKKSRTRNRRLDGEQEAQLVMLACSVAPEGRVRWTLRLLRDKTIEFGIVESIGVETVRRTLKKTHLNLGRGKSGAFPQRLTRHSSAQWRMC